MYIKHDNINIFFKASTQNGTNFVDVQYVAAYLSTMYMALRMEASSNSSLHPRAGFQPKHCQKVRSYHSTQEIYSPFMLSAYESELLLICPGKVSTHAD